MFDRVSVQLREWVESAGDKVEILLSAPTREFANDSINLYLFELKQQQSFRSRENTSFGLWLRYLVTAWSSDETRAQHLLGKLLLATHKNKTFEINLDAPTATFWLALGIPPRPCFILELPYQEAMPAETVQRVQEPLQVQFISPPTKSGG